MVSLIAEFFVFSFLGWIIDSLYCSIYARKWVSSGYFKGVPFCPLYGIYGILLLKIFEIFETTPFYFNIVCSAIIMIILEYFTGLLAEKVLHKKLWDYSMEKPNINDRISLWHSFLWLTGVSLMYLIKYYLI